jgi:imidazoleglycerol phosphate dehydratase HisB
MNLAKIFLSVFMAVGMVGCVSHKAGEYSAVHAWRFNHADVPLDMAWQKAIDAIGNRWEIIADDTVEKTLTVKTFYNNVEVSFVALTANTSKYTVSSRSYMGTGNKASINSVYLELERALKQLED